MHRLLTIPFSHYNEKARWGLDRYHQAYREEPWLPGLHVLPIAWAARGAEGERASPGATPLLITTDGRKLGDSTSILRWLDRHRPGEGPPLYPVPASLELEQRFDLRGPDGTVAHQPRQQQQRGPGRHRLRTPRYRHPPARRRRSGRWPRCAD